MIDEGLDLLDRALAVFGIGPTSWWLVEKGNQVILLEIRSRTALRAENGDRVPVKGGGFVQRFDKNQGWVQWRWYGDEESAPPLQGKVLQGPPARYRAPSDADLPGK